MGICRWGFGWVDKAQCFRSARRFGAVDSSPDFSGFFTTFGFQAFNPIPTRGGGTLCPPPPPQVHFLKYLRNALSYGLETFWQFKWIKLKNKNLFFNRLRPPLVTIATFKVDACFWKAHFGSFHAKAYQNSMFFAIPMKNGQTGLLWKFGLNIPQDGVLVTVFVSHSFSCFNDLKMGNTISMATRMVSFDLVLHKLSENVSFVDLQQGEHGFSFWMGIPSKKSEIYEPP